MQTLITNNNQSLIDLALQLDGKLDSLLLLARENDLPLDYTFSDSQPLRCGKPDASLQSFLQGSIFSTGLLEHVHAQGWILSSGFWNDNALWDDKDSYND